MIRILCFAVVFALSESAFPASTPTCKGLEAPTNVESKQQTLDTFTVINSVINYTDNFYNLTYICPGEATDGIFFIFGLIVTQKAANAKDNSTDNDSREFAFENFKLQPIPGLNLTLPMHLRTTTETALMEIKFDGQGFEIITSCVTEQNSTKTSSPWTKDTPVGTNFPFTFTDKNTLRFQMDKCKSGTSGTTVIPATTKS